MNDKQIDNSNYLPFNIQWLDSSYQQTCLPDSPWQQVNSRFLFSEIFYFEYIKLDS